MWRSCEAEMSESLQVFFSPEENSVCDCFLKKQLDSGSSLRSIVSATSCFLSALLLLLFGQRGGNSTAVQLLTAHRGQDMVLTQEVLVTAVHPQQVLTGLLPSLKGQSRTGPHVKSDWTHYPKVWLAIRPVRGGALWQVFLEVHLFLTDANMLTC